MFACNVNLLNVVSVLDVCDFLLLFFGVFCKIFLFFLLRIKKYLSLWADNGVSAVVDRG